MFIIPGFPAPFNDVLTALKMVLFTFGPSLLNVSIEDMLTLSSSNLSTIAAATFAPSACPNINAV